MEWHCKECAHEKVCEEWGEQEGMAACSYQNHFEPKQGAPVEKLDGPLVGRCEGPLPADLGKLSRQNCPNAGILGTDDILARYEDLASKCDELFMMCAGAGANTWAAHQAACRDAIREFGLYCWDTSGTGGDRVVKSNDHAMDDIRYFAATVAAKNGGSFFAGSVERASI